MRGNSHILMLVFESPGHLPFKRRRKYQNQWPDSRGPIALWSELHSNFTGFSLSTWFLNLWRKTCCLHVFIVVFGDANMRPATSFKRLVQGWNEVFKTPSESISNHFHCGDRPTSKSTFCDQFIFFHISTKECSSQPWFHPTSLLENRLIIFWTISKSIAVFWKSIWKSILDFWKSTFKKSILKSDWFSAREKSFFKKSIDFLRRENRVRKNRLIFQDEKIGF